LGPSSIAHIIDAGRIFLIELKQVKKDHPDWSQEYQLKGAVAAYNMGAKNVQTISGMDNGTTGGDYSNDVIARAQFFAGF
jgi:hypothetical protein